MDTFQRYVRMHITVVLKSQCLLLIAERLTYFVRQNKWTEWDSIAEKVEHTFNKYKNTHMLKYICTYLLVWRVKDGILECHCLVVSPHQTHVLLQVGKYVARTAGRHVLSIKYEKALN